MLPEFPATHILQDGETVDNPSPSCIKGAVLYDHKNNNGGLIGWFRVHPDGALEYCDIAKGEVCFQPIPEQHKDLFQ